MLCASMVLPVPGFALDEQRAAERVMATLTVCMSSGEAM